MLLSKYWCKCIDCVHCDAKNLLCRPGPNEEYELKEEDLHTEVRCDDFKEKTSETKIEKAIKCLIDNGIEEDEAQVVLQALGYILLDEELFPEKE